MKTRARPRAPTESNRWTIGLARKNFSGVLRAAERAPQAIYRRSRIQAVIINPSDADRAHLTPGPAPGRSVYEAFEGIRQIARETGWELPVASRADRPNGFLKTRRQRSR